jgi:hypothetical protein
VAGRALLVGAELRRPMPKNPVLIDCTFCGDKGVPRSIEDVFPLWLGRKLAHQATVHHPEVQPNYVDYTYDNLEVFKRDLHIGDLAKTNTTYALPTAYRLRAVCGRCNGGWMGRLEEAARLLMVGFLIGTQKHLAPYDQCMLGMWAIKSSLAYDASYGEQDDDEVRHVRRNGAPGDCSFSGARCRTARCTLVMTRTTSLWDSWPTAGWHSR